MPRTKRPYTDQTTSESKSPAKRQKGVRIKGTAAASKAMVTVPRPPLVFTDIPSVTKELGVGGEYAYKIDLGALEMLAQTHASYDQLASVLNVPEHVLFQPEYKEIIEQARSVALVNLRSAQFKAAIEDRNPTMQIWLGKQYLNQKDIVQSQQLGADGKPINPSAPTFVAVMPPNGRDLDPSRRLPTRAAFNGTPIEDKPALPAKTE